jgi:hypothetical protein
MKYGYVCRRPTSPRHRCVTLPGCIRPRSRQRHCRFLRHVAQLHARGGSLHCLRERVFAALRGGKVRPHACVAKISALLLGSDRPKTLSLRNPRRSVSVGREAVCFLHKFAKACDPDFVSVPVLEYFGVLYRSWARLLPARQKRPGISRCNATITTTAHADHSSGKRLIQLSVNPVYRALGRSVMSARNDKPVSEPERRRAARGPC